MDDNVWLEFKEKLNLPYVRASCKLPVDWQTQILTLRQTVMRGMAFNTPDPPGPTQVGYPPLVALQQLVLWARKAFDKTDPAKSLFFVDDGFRDYFFALLNLIAFVLNQLRSTINGQDDEEVSSDAPLSMESLSDDHDHECVPEVPSPTSGLVPSGASTGPGPARPTKALPEKDEKGDDDSSSGEIAVLEDAPGGFVAQPQQAVVTGGPPAEVGPYAHVEGFVQDPDGDKWCDPLSDAAVQFFLEFVDEMWTAVTAASAGAAGAKQTLYEKYKNQTTGPGGEDPKEIAEDTLENLCPPLSEIFGPSKRARLGLKSHPLLHRTWEFAKHSNPRVRMVYSLANTIDEEFIVLHAEEKKGFRVNVCGCSDNKMFGIALASALINAEGLTGTPPSQAVLELFSSEEQALETNETYAHPWSFSNWTCVKPDGTVPLKMAGASHWIWPEGSPSQIQKFGAHRVVILTKAPFPRKFDPVRVFSGLFVSAKVVEKFTDDQYTAFLNQLAQADQNLRQQAIDSHLKWK